MKFAAASAVESPRSPRRLIWWNATAVESRPDTATPAVRTQKNGVPAEEHDAHREELGATRREAFRTPFFWVLTAGVAVSGLLSTAVAFHQISLLGERGLSTAEAAANFIPQTVAGLVATLATGHLVDRMSSRWLTVASMLMLAAALVWAVVVDPGWSAIAFGVALGASGSSIRALESASVPKYFG